PNTGRITTMSSATVKQRVLDLLRTSSHPLDDDELARRLDVSPRQAINRVCLDLAAQGLVRRRSGPDGKLVNELTVVDGPAAPVSPSPTTGGASAPNPTLPPGDSQEQRLSEKAMIEILGRELGLDLAPRTLPQIDGVRIEVDAADPDLTVLVEAWAHQGSPKPAQKLKVLADALKLVWIRSTLDSSPRLILCFSDVLAAHHFSGARTWAATALADLGVEVHALELPVDIRAAVRAAQERQ
ncbi:MAG: MarR family transcriptional regulator, partial [Actinomycetota bacterium]|nr:MarR family transcriptional regulator [Actinomycetota bacterium]